MMRVSLRRVLQVAFLLTSLIVFSTLFNLNLNYKSYRDGASLFDVRAPVDDPGGHRDKREVNTAKRNGQSLRSQINRQNYQRKISEFGNDQNSFNLKVDDIVRTPRPRPTPLSVGAKSMDNLIGQKINTDVKHSNSQHFIPHQRGITEIKDIFISVKTTGSFHKTRLELLLQTWWIFARDETYFFSDVNDEEYIKKTRGHLINTNCSVSHTRTALCCKMSVEFDSFINSGKRWFCHVDDDTYVNIPALVKLLQQYNHVEDHYLGKPSLLHPIEITLKPNSLQKIAFWFATGGAGFCLSRGIALKMVPYTGGGKLTGVCNQIRLPDDCTVGFIVHYYLHKELTVIPKLHSHLEGLWKVNGNNLKSQITLSYGKRHNRKPNIVDVNLFNITEDPTRFKSVHCTLFPYMKECSQTR